jgi:hypothetical protein
MDRGQKSWNRKRILVVSDELLIVSEGQYLQLDVNPEFFKFIHTKIDSPWQSKRNPL